MTKIMTFLKSKGAVVDEGIREHIETWRCWYRGLVPNFHNYEIFNGQKRVPNRRLSLGMAKKASEDFANLLLNEHVAITSDNEKFSALLAQTLEANKFFFRGNQLIEKTFALGTGALVEWKDSDGRVVIDYVEADMIFPITVENGEITEAAFASEKTSNGKKVFYVQIHRRGAVENYLLNDAGKPTALPAGVAAAYPAPVRLFQIIKPNIVNNIEMTSAMGISVFANAIDPLRGVDTVYDSLVNDFVIGRSRVLVPMKYATIQQTANGTKKPIFDTNDTVFYVFESPNEQAKMEFHQPDIRASEHVVGLNRALSLFSDKCGLGNDRYRFEGSGLQTATQVISEKSELYQNIRKHELLLGQALRDMTKAVASLSGMEAGVVGVKFDDSIIEDSGARKAQFIAEINAGIRQAWEYRVEFLGEDETTARLVTGEIAATDTSEPPEPEPGA